MASTRAKNHQKISPKDDMLDWWIGTVLLTFFPLIVSAVMGLCTTGSIDFNRLFGDGELILSAFLISTPSLIKLHNNNVTDKRGKVLFYALLIISFLQLVAYTSTKLNQLRQTDIVYTTSALCVISSVVIAGVCEKHLS